MSRSESETKTLRWRGYTLVRAPGLFVYKGALRLDGNNSLLFEVKPAKVSATTASRRGMPRREGFAATIHFNGHHLITDFGITESDALENSATLAATSMGLILDALNNTLQMAPEPYQQPRVVFNTLFWSRILSEVPGAVDAEFDDERGLVFVAELQRGDVDPDSLQRIAADVEAEFPLYDVRVLVYTLGPGEPTLKVAFPWLGASAPKRSRGAPNSNITIASSTSPNTTQPHGLPKTMPTTSSATQIKNNANDIPEE